jgi:hypothetical protein
VSIECINTTGFPIESLAKRLPLIRLEAYVKETLANILASLTADKNVITKNEYFAWIRAENFLGSPSQFFVYHTASHKCCRSGDTPENKRLDWKTYGRPHRGEHMQLYEIVMYLYVSSPRGSQELAIPLIKEKPYQSPTDQVTSIRQVYSSKLPGPRGLKSKATILLLFIELNRTADTQVCHSLART